MSKRLIEKFWTAMATNEFGKASGLLAPEYEYYMPQTTEYIRGPEAFAALNSAYPTDGTWTFNIRSIVAEHDTAVSDVAVSDGTLSARAITFHTVEAGLIVR
ncbi:MAG: nuclear transport factor 2 family protein, partial [Pseudomonadota bacterium]